MTGGVRIGILIAAMLCSSIGRQTVSGMDWLSGLHESIGELNRNIQRNVQQLNQQVQQTVQSNLAQVHRLTENLNEELADRSTGPSTVRIIGGNNIVATTNDGTRIVQSGRTSDGKPYVRETSDKIVGDTLRHVERIYDPSTNVSRVHGYTLDLKDPHAKPVPIDDGAA